MLRQYLILTLAVLILASTAWSAAPPCPPLRDAHGHSLPDGAIARLGTLRYRLPNSQSIGLAFTAKGDRIVAATVSSVDVFDVQTGRRSLAVSVDFDVRCFALSRDGQMAAVAGYTFVPGRESEYVVRVVNVADGKEVRTWRRDKQQRSTSSLAFSADGKLLASLDEVGLLRLEEIKSGDELLRHQFVGGSRSSMAFSPDGMDIAVVSSKLYTWRWKRGNEPTMHEMPWGLTAPSFSPDGQYLAVGNDREVGIRRLDLTTGKPIKPLLAGKDMLDTVCYSPDGRYLAATSYADRAIRLLDAKSGDVVRKFPCRDRYIRTIAFSSDSRRIATTENGVLRIWEVATGKELSDVESHWQAPNFVRLLDDVAVTAGDDGTVRFWDARSGKQTKRIDVSQHWLRAAAVSPDGRWLAASELGETQAVSLWDLRTTKQVYRLAGHGRLGGQRRLMFTPDSRQLASWGDDQYLRLWDVAKGKAIEEHGLKPDGKGGPLEEAGPRGRERQMMAAFHRVAFSGNARQFALPREDSIFVFEVTNGKQVAKLQNHGSMVTELAFSPDGRSLLVAAWGQSRLVTIGNEKRQQVVRDPPSVCLHDLATGKMSVHLTFPNTSIDCAAMRPDAKGFAVGFDSPTNAIRFYDAGGTQTAVIDLPARPRVLAYSSDSKRILVSIGDTTCLVYSVPAR